MINTRAKVYFYDDRNKADCYGEMGCVYYEDETDCLCAVFLTDISEPAITVLFSKENGEVLTSNLQFWYATNDKNLVE